MDGATGKRRGSPAEEEARAVAPQHRDFENLDVPAAIARMKAASEIRHDRLSPPTEEELAQRRRFRLERVGVPRKYWTADWSEVDGDLMLAAQEWLAGLAEHVVTGKNLWLGGSVGVGKSMALALVADEAAVQLGDDAVRYVYAPELFDRLVQAEDLNDVFGSWVWPAVLLIDDLGREYDASWPMARFTTVIENRYAEKPTVVASNLSPKQLRESNQAWEPVCSRLVESMIGTWQAGPDRRRKGRDT